MTLFCLLGRSKLFFVNFGRISFMVYSYFKNQIIQKYVEGAAQGGEIPLSFAPPLNVF